MKIRDILNEKTYSDAEILAFVDSEIESLKKQGDSNIPDRRTVLNGIKAANRTAKGRNMSLASLYSIATSDRPSANQKPQKGPDYVDADDEELRRDKLGRVLRAKRYYQDQIKNAPTRAGRLAAQSALNKIFSIMDRNQ